MKPAIPLTDRRFDYVNAAQTDLRKTFARVRREQAKAQAIAAASNVRPLQPKKGTA